jgi:hypothetical protein
MVPSFIIIARVINLFTKFFDKKKNITLLQANIDGTNGLKP